MSIKPNRVWTDDAISEIATTYFQSKNRVRRLQFELNWAKRQMRDSEETLMGRLNLTDETIEWKQSDLPY